ncbi:MAG: (Fe-S)-binding protein, partial [Phycisphaerales bacterium]|nr:(Fe-S)-binding protein [Phycisphaerales bacterium]
GQPPFNAGRCGEARAIAEHFVRVFQDADLVVTPSGSCAAMIKRHYVDLLADSECLQDAIQLGERVWELSQFLVDHLGVDDVGARLPGRATIHDGCHGLRELGISSAPRRLLEHVRDLRLIESRESETCCGFGGLFAVKFPSIATAMADVKCAAVAEADVDYVISCDASCLMHIQGLLDRRGDGTKCLHLAEALVSA